VKKTPIKGSGEEVDGLQRERSYSNMHN